MTAEDGRTRWALWIPVGVGAGIGLYFVLPAEPPAWAGGVATLIAALVAVVARARPAARLAAFGALAVAAGFAAAQFRADAVAAPVLAERLGPVSVEGRVLEVEDLPKGARVVLDRARVSRLAAPDTPERIRLRLNRVQPEVRPGVWIRARAVLTPPPPPPAPGAFDFQRQAWFQRLGGVGFALGAVEVSPARPGSGDEFAIALQSLREAIADRVRAAVPGDAGAVAAALMTGVRGAISEPAMEDMRESGLAHLLAISGMNIGLVAALVFGFLRAALALAPPIALRHPVKKWAAVAGIAVAGGYALIAGWSVPTQRAFLMVGLVFVAVLCDRRAISMRLVAVAAALILLLTPESLLGASFQMSFAATMALVALYDSPAARRWLRPVEGRGPLPRLAAYAAGIALMSLVAGLATAPFAAYHFNRLAAYGLIANMAAVPLNGLWVMPWMIVAFAALPFGLESVPLALMGWGCEATLKVAAAVASWPGATGLVPALPVTALAAAALGGIWICLWPGRARLAGLAGIAVAFGLAALDRPPDVLIDAGGRLFALRMADGELAFSSRRGGRFEREVWLRRAALEDAGDAAVWEGRAPDGRVGCDRLGCVYRAGGRMVSLARSADALAEDCGRADVVVGLVAAFAPCPAGRFVGLEDLAREGAHAIWLSDGEVRIETVNGARGARPWVVRPPARNGGGT